MSSKATIIEEDLDQGFDLQLLSIYVMGFAALIGIGYYVKSLLTPSAEEGAKKQKVKKASAPVPDVRTLELDTDWITSDHLNAAGRRTSPRLKKRKA